MTPPATSPSADAPIVPAADAAAADAAAAAAAIPDTADGYAFTVSDKARGLLGDVSQDPAVAAAREFAKSKGWTQGQFDDHIGGLVNHLAEKGLFEPTFDPKAQTTALGEHGATRQRELYTFAESLKTRGEINEEQFGELISLIPTKPGTELLEFLRKQMRGGGVDTGGGPAGDTADAKAKAQQMAADPKYHTDRAFRKEADAAWVAAYGGRVSNAR